MRVMITYMEDVNTGPYTKLKSWIINFETHIKNVYLMHFLETAHHRMPEECWPSCMSPYGVTRR